MYVEGLCHYFNIDYNFDYDINKEILDYGIQCDIMYSDKRLIEYLKKQIHSFINLHKK